jgi:hypothetical protein
MSELNPKLHSSRAPQSSRSPPTFYLAMIIFCLKYRRLLGRVIPASDWFLGGYEGHPSHAPPCAKRTLLERKIEVPLVWRLLMKVTCWDSTLAAYGSL